MADWFQDEECRREDESRMTNKTTSATDLVERLAVAATLLTERGLPFSAQSVEQAADTITRLQAALAKQRQVVDTAIIHKLETQSHGGLTEFGEGGLAALRAVEREFQRIEAVGGE